MNFELRKYREKMGGGRFQPLLVRVDESDLWLGISNCRNPGIFKEKIINFVYELRRSIQNYIDNNPDFKDSHIPLPVSDEDDKSIKEMKLAAIAANTGPMAAIAGHIAACTLKYMESLFPESEIIVENGGDVFMKIYEDIVISPFAGNNQCFSEFGFCIDSGYKYLSICASSGRFGHSFSYGKADLVAVFSKNACLADAFATSLANKIQNRDDVDKIAETLPENILGILAVKEDKMAYNGPFHILSVCP